MANYNSFFKAAREARVPEQAPRKAKKKSQPRKPGKGFPIPLGLVLTVAIGLCGAVWSLMNVEKIETALDKVDIKFLSSALAEQAATPAKTSQPADAKAEKTATDVGHEGKPSTVVNKSWTPDQISVFNKLEERKNVLDLKEQELTKLEEELQKQRVELEDRLKDLEKLRAKIAERLTERVGVDQNRVDKLVDIYSNMKPQTAAKVFEEIDEDLAVEILGKMKKKSMAEILNLLKADKAQRLSEKFAGYKRQ